MTKWKDNPRRLEVRITIILRPCDDFIDEENESYCPKEGMGAKGAGKLVYKALKDIMELNKGLYVDNLEVTA